MSVSKPSSELQIVLFCFSQEAVQTNSQEKAARNWWIPAPPLAGRFLAERLSAQLAETTTVSSWDYWA